MKPAIRWRSKPNGATGAIYNLGIDIYADTFRGEPCFTWYVYSKSTEYARGHEDSLDEAKRQVVLSIRVLNADGTRRILPDPDPPPEIVKLSLFEEQS